MSSTPFVQINDDLIINLFQTASIIRRANGDVDILQTSDTKVTLFGAEAARFMAYVHDLSDQMPETAEPAPAPGTSARDFGAILGDDEGTNHPAAELPQHGETPTGNAEA